MENARARSEEIIEDVIQNAASYLAGLQRMTGIELSRQLGRGLVNSLQTLSSKSRLETHTPRMKRQQHLDQHEREKADVRQNAEEEYHIDH